MRIARTVQLGFLASGPLVWCPLIAPAQQPAPSESPLQGPRVAEPDAKPTLVERDFAGKLKRLEVSPEEAALALLKLDSGAASKTQSILNERAAILDKIVLDNLDLVVQIHNSRAGGDKRAQLKLLAELMTALKPLTDRGTLSEEIVAALSLDQSVTFKALVREYNQAASAETQAESRAAGERLTVRQISARENLIVLGTDIKRSYERQISSKTAEFEQIMAQLDLVPEQESKIRGMVLDYAQSVKGKPTQEQRRALIFRIMAVLDSDQQRTLVRLMVERDG
jgi:hypothetical protein